MTAAARKKMEPGYDGNPPLLVEPDPERRAKWDDDQVGLENRNTNRIEFLKHRKIIDGAQAEAARRFQRDYELSEILPMASSVLVGAGGSSGNLPNDEKVQAMKRRGEALRCLGAEDGNQTFASRVVDMIVIREWTAKQASDCLGKHDQFVMGVLSLALDILAAHYGLATNRRGRQI